MRKPYPTDLSDAQWTRLRLCLPTPNVQGRPRIHSLHGVFDAFFYVLKSGCHWRLLPHDFPPWSSVYYHFRRFRLSGLWYLILKVLRSTERKRAGKDPQPTAAILDSHANHTQSAHRNQASQEAARVLIPPTRRPCCSLAPSVTTLLHTTAIVLASGKPLGARFW